MIKEKIQRLVNQSDFQQAYDLLSFEIERRSFDEDIHLLQSICAEHLGKYELLHELLANMERYNANPASIKYVQAVILMYEDRLDEAYELNKQVLEVEPFESIFYYQKAKLLSLLGFPEMADAPIQRCIEISPELSYPYALLVEIYRETGNLLEAMELVGSGLSYHPESPSLLTLYGLLKLDLGFRSEAEEIFAQQLKKYPTDKGLKQAYALALKSKNPIYYVFSKKARQISANFSGFQMIYVAMLAFLSMTLLSTVLRENQEINWIFRAIILVVILLSIIAIYFDPIMNISLLRRPEYARYLTQSERRYYRLLGFSLGIGILLVGAFLILGFPWLVVSAFAIFIALFFLQDVVQGREANNVWSVFSLLAFVGLTGTSLVQSIQQHEIFTGSFVWLILLVVVHLWVSRMYSRN